MIYGYKITATSVLWYFYSKSDHVVIGKFLGKISLGHYSLAFNLASLPGEKFLSLIGKVVFPLFSKIQDSEITLQRYFLKITRLVAFIAFPIFAGMYLVAALAIPLLLSEKWSPIIMPFRILCFISILGTLSSFNFKLVNAKGRPGIGFFNMVICSLVMPPGFLVGSMYSIKGVCYAWLFLYPILFLIMTKRAINVIGLTLSTYLKNLISPFTATCFMVASVYLSKILLLNYPNKMFQLTLYCSIGVIFYSAFVVVFFRGLLSEIRSLIVRK